MIVESPLSPAPAREETVSRPRLRGRLVRDDRVGDLAAVSRPTLTRTDALGEAPVEHHHLAEISQRHVLSLEIAMHDAPRMGKRQRMTNPDKRCQERYPLDRIRLAGGPFRMIGPDGVAQRAPRTNLIV